MKIVHYEIAETPSTNETAKQLMHLWNPYVLTIVSTQNQTEGKGKFNRSWISSSKDITLSLCFFITEFNLDISRLFRLGTDIVLQLLHDLEILHATIKWPNDILVNGKKLCGVLSETLPSQGYLGVVLGIGINGNSLPEDLISIQQPATSLAILLQHSIDLKQVKDTLAYHAQTIISSAFPYTLAREAYSG
ncbi:biotin--[acetyl-CoA-carboxylase] ligase [Chlamydia gallinacea]|uniref:biotin--[acetyl-CoA-carboxylase] ligase n=1 Tax=Chlamydia gallinacea TaxID=1457153 RepID=UPI0024E26CE5|nr:biotin--[acetyl-CoA-carboxylase] ligase [Chlamydia gallinacea]